MSRDAQDGRVRPTDLLGPWAEGRRIALAGALTGADLPALVERPELRVVVGSAVTNAPKPIDAVHGLRRAAGKD